MRKTWTQLAVGLLVMAVIFYFTLKPVNMGDLWRSMVSCNWLWAPAFVAVTMLSMWARALRWRYLMRPAGSFTARRLFGPMMAGFAINSLLPARLGEFARAYVLSAREKIPFGAVFATVVVERIFDTLTLLVLLVVVFSRLKVDPSLTLEYAGFKITGAMMDSLTAKLAWIGAITLAGSLFLLWSRGRAMVQWCVGRAPLVPSGFKSKINGLIETFSDGLHSLRDFRSWAAIILLSAAVWVLVGFSMQVMSWGFSGLHVNLAQGIAITVLAALAIMPFPTPGYWGPMQLGIMFALLIMGIESDRARALGYAFVVHGLQYFPIVAVGLWGLWRERISFSEVTRMGRDKQ